MVVTLSDLARATARRSGVLEVDVQRARRSAYSERELPDCILVHAELRPGIRLRMRCQHGRPGHIMSLDLVS